MDNKELFVVRSNGKKIASFNNKIDAKNYRDCYIADHNQHAVVNRGKDHWKGETK